MLSLFKSSKIFRFPVTWANSVTNWCLGLNSPSGTIRVRNTANPSDTGAEIDVDLNVVASKMKDLLSGTFLSSASFMDNLMRSIDGASLIAENDVIHVNEDWVRAIAGSGSGTVSSVDGVSPGANGNVALGALKNADIGVTVAAFSHTHSGYAEAEHTHEVEDITDLPDCYATDPVEYTGAVAAYVMMYLNGTIGYGQLSSAGIDYGEGVTNVTSANFASQAISAGLLTKSVADGYYAASEHEHEGYASAQTLLDLTTVVQGIVNDYITSSELSSALAGYSLKTHTHTGYAASNHTHSGYAPTSHSHTSANITDFETAVKSYIPNCYESNPVEYTGAVSAYVMMYLNGTVAYGQLHTSSINYGEGVTNVTSSNLASQAATAGLLTKLLADGYYAAAEHTHTEYAASDHDHNSLYASISSVETLASTVSGIVSNYVTSAALTSALAGYSPVGHGHSGYAAASHTHSGYAESSHTHTASDITDFATKVKSYIPDCYESSPVQYTGAVSAYVMMYLNGTIGYGQLSMENFSGTASKLYGTNSSGTFAAVASLLTSAPSSDKVLTVKSGGTAITWEDGGGGSPENPSSKTTANITSEGTATADTTSWTYAGSKGMQLTVCSRVMYDHTAATPVLYGFYRTWTFDKKGRLYSISAETRYEIDTPVVGNLTT